MNIQDIYVKDLQGKIDMLTGFICDQQWTIIDGTMASTGIIINAIKNTNLSESVKDKLAKDIAKLILETVNIDADFEE